MIPWSWLILATVSLGYPNFFDEYHSIRAHQLEYVGNAPRPLFLFQKLETEDFQSIQCISNRIYVACRPLPPNVFRKGMVWI